MERSMARLSRPSDVRQRVRMGSPTTGAAYLLHGPFQAGDHPVAGGRIFTGEREADNAGRSMAGGEDPDGDGLDDLLVGAIYFDDGDEQEFQFAGKGYLITDR